MKMNFYFEDVNEIVKRVSIMSHYHLLAHKQHSNSRL